MELIKHIRPQFNAEYQTLEEHREEVKLMDNFTSRIQSLKNRVNVSAAADCLHHVAMWLKLTGRDEESAMWSQQSTDLAAHANQMEM